MKRRILYILSRFPNVSTTFIANEMTELRELGADIHIAAIWRSLEGEPHPTEQPFLDRVTRLNIRNPRLWLTALAQIVRKPALIGVILRLIAGHTVSPWSPLKLLANIPKGLYMGAWVRQHHIENIHGHFLTAPATVALIASKVSGVPFTVTVHAFDIYDDSPRNRNGSVRYKLDSAAHVICISEYNKRYILERWYNKNIDPPIHQQTPIVPVPPLYPVETGLMGEVIYNGIDLNLFIPPAFRRPIPQNARILTNGSFSPKKGHALLISAVAQVRAAGYPVTLDIIGRGPLETELRALVDQLNLRDAVRFLGIMAQDKIVQHYYDADLFALACVIASDGDRDGIPTVLIEALATELPAISTHVSGIPELIIEGETGRCVDPDFASLANAIIDLIDHPDQARLMAQRGHAHAAAHFDRRINVRRLYDLF